jgi:L-lactate dehydrogenase (cytochrome)
MADDALDPRFPSVPLLRARARQRMPSFAFEYLDGGCLDEVGLARNTDAIRALELEPRYLLADYPGATLETELFGRTYAAPFGIAPVGLQGLMWPRACEILAEAAHARRLPFILSTVSTCSIERVGELTEGAAWFQLYHPRDDALRDDLLERARASGVDVLVLLADTPTFAWRPKEIRNGLSIPPRLTLANVLEMVTHPSWSLGQLAAGVPEFATVKPYLPKGLSLRHLGEFMNRTFDGRLTPDRIARLRDRWKGRLVVKGVVHPEDAERAVALGVDGIIVSNHGGRQIDVGPATVTSLGPLAEAFGDRLTVMMDSGIRSGADVAVALAAGAAFTFLGRTPMYAVGALGARGGAHALTMLERQLRQVMEQLGCETVAELRTRLRR